MPGEPEPGIAPEDQSPRHAGDPIMLRVDGHEFRVRVRLGEPGSYDFDWLTGPHDYGFGLFRDAGAPLSRAEMEEAIRGFLAEIDPATGYLAE